MGVIDDLIATAQPRTERVRICARGDLVASHASAVLLLDAAISGEAAIEDDPAVTQAAGDVKAIEDEMEAATVTFTVAAVSRQVWANLLAEHPPSKEQRRQGHDHDPDVFPVAAVAACVSDPSLSVDEARKLADVLPAGEFNKLWVQALTLNITGTPAPKLAAATELLRLSEQSSTTPPPEGSVEDVGLVSGASR